MKTFNHKIIYSTLIAVVMAMQISIGQELAPDQNPNYKRSMDKYMAIKDELVKTEGTTVQATYKAIDDVQLKKERKELRKQNRQDRRMARITARGQHNNYYRPFRGYDYSPYSYNHHYNPYSPYGYYQPYQNYYPSYSPSIGFNINPACALLGLGLGAYLLFQ